MPSALATDALFRRFYYDVPGFVDGTSEFHRLCEKYVPPGERILEIGPGPASCTSRFLSRLGPVVGADITDELLANPWLSEAHVYNGRELPFPNCSFAACVSDYVLEHIEDPVQHFREVARVLAPGSAYCLRTPNRWHYVPLVSRMLPHRVHVLAANRLRGLPESAHEPYRTVYGVNSMRLIKKMAAQAGLRLIELAMVEKEPSYVRAHPLLFVPMMLYERAVNGLQSLKCFRANIFAVLQKPRLTSQQESNARSG